MLLSYIKEGRLLKASSSNPDFELASNDDGNRHTIKLKALVDLTLDGAELALPLRLRKKDLYFLNGYQSWTDSKEVNLSFKEKNIKKMPSFVVKPHALDKYGDSEFYQYSSSKLHGYDIFYSKGINEIFIYSLNYKTAYLIIELRKNKKEIRLLSDVKGLTLKAGEEATIFDYRFFDSHDEGIQNFNEDFPSLNKEKIFGYTSWYNYYTSINEGIILRDLEAIDERFNVFQIDDGYETAVGDWLHIDKAKFPKGFKEIIAKVHQKGLKAGIWLAPFAAETNSMIFKEKKEWLVSDENGNPLICGDNWSKFYALDFYNPEVRDYIKNCLDFYIDLGFDFFKLDFLYASALYPVKGKTRCMVQREAYQFLREALKDKLILGCGANIINSYEAFDYLRVGPDVSLIFDDVFYMRMLHRERISTKTTIQNTIYRSIFNQHLFGNDPDVFLLRDDNISLSKKQKESLIVINALFGSVLMTSDNLSSYDEEKREILSEALEIFKNAKVTSVQTLKSSINITYEMDGISHRLSYDPKKGELTKYE